MVKRATSLFKLFCSDAVKQVALSSFTVALVQWVSAALVFDMLILFPLFFKPPNGLLALLDDESRSVQATDAGYVKKCDTVHKKHPSYAAPKLGYPGFTIRHYRSQVSKSWNQYPSFSNIKAVSEFFSPHMTFYVLFIAQRVFT